MMLCSKMKQKTHLFAAIAVLVFAISACLAKPIYPSRLIHRLAHNGSNETTSWSEKKNFGQVRILLGSDLKRQKLKFGAQNQFLVASQGSQTFDYGNDLGWLHYTWIDIGMPSKSFLVALDTGSDTSWVPCDCIQCAPLSLSHYNMLDRELSEYNPSHSNSSKSVPCSHELCSLGHNCKTPKEHCPYTVSYASEDTSSSGFLFEDKLHLASVGGNEVQDRIKASIIIGCGSKQSGSYLDGMAPDGLLGLGPGEISIPSLLAKSGLVSHSFSFCYDKSYSGTLFFGDQGPASQRSTSLSLSKDDPIHYIVELESFCVGKSCPSQTVFKTLVDTGTSFTYVPREIYELVVTEFDRQVNAPRIAKEGFDYCYKDRSLKIPKLPNLKLVFPVNQSFVVENPMLHIADDQGDLYYCLGMFSTDEDIGVIGQNFLMGYRVVFDWEKSKLGWSISDCQDIANGSSVHYPAPQSATTPTLPANQQQQHGHAVAPAVAGRATPNASLAAPRVSPYHEYCILTLLMLILCTAYVSSEGVISL